MVRVKRIYDQCESADGCRVLVDALWPRGIRKEAAKVDVWLKAIAPSAGLRRWFSHDPARWEEFNKRYAAELARNPEPVRELRGLAREHGNISLLYAARDPEHNNARALKSLLRL